DVQTYVKLLALPPAAMRQRHDHPAGRDAIVELLQLCDPFTNVFRQPRRRIHVLVDDLGFSFHDTTSFIEHSGPIAGADRATSQGRARFLAAEGSSLCESPWSRSFGQSCRPRRHSDPAF